MSARAVVVASCLVLAAASVASYLIGPRTDLLTGTIRLARKLDAAVPASLAGWTGTDEPMPPEIVRTTLVDDYVRRRYTDGAGSEVLLYVAYHGNKARGMQTYYHNPTVCFPSQGWSLESEKSSTETLRDAARDVPLCRYVFSKEGVRLSVLTFFQINRELLDQSPRNKPLWMLLDRATPQLDDSPGTFVQVQIVTPVGAGGESVASAVQSRFLADFGAAILRAVEPGAAQ